MRRAEPIFARLAAMLAAVAVVGAPAVASARSFYLMHSSPEAWIVVDPAAIERAPDGQTSRMAMVTVVRSLVSGADPQPGYIRAVNEYDCAGQRLRWRNFAAFSRDGAQMLTRTNAASDWEDIKPGAPTMVELRLACGQSTGDSVVEAESVAKVVIALLRTWDTPVTAAPVAPAAPKTAAKAPPAKRR